jgi:hypothetical protein
MNHLETDSPALNYIIINGIMSINQVVTFTNYIPIKKLLFHNLGWVGVYEEFQKLDKVK